mmetsp:Transcript_40966/g.73669  ORF Transcript_40966/g.73669 Transcript_40966/m.73669 type:complete len:346 (-) Transcript_40966:1206-2243(-)
MPDISTLHNKLFQILRPPGGLLVCFHEGIQLRLRQRLKVHDGCLLRLLLESGDQFSVAETFVELGRIIGDLTRARCHSEDSTMNGSASAKSEILLMIKLQGCLCHRQHDDILTRINREGRAAKASPAVLSAGGSRCQRSVGLSPALELALLLPGLLLVMLHLDLPKEVVPLTLLVKHPCSPTSSSSRHLVADHCLHGLPPEDAHSVELAKVAEHEQEAEVVPESGHHATLDGQGNLNRASARQDLGYVVANIAAVLASLVQDLEVVSATRCNLLVALFIHWRSLTVEGAKSVRFLRRHVEPSVGHTQRTAHLLLNSFVQGLPGDDLQNSSQHIGSEGILPVAARI